MQTETIGHLGDTHDGPRVKMVTGLQYGDQVIVFAKREACRRRGEGKHRRFWKWTLNVRKDVEMKHKPITFEEMKAVIDAAPEGFRGCREKLARAGGHINRSYDRAAPVALVEVERDAEWLMQNFELLPA